MVTRVAMPRCRLTSATPVSRPPPAFILLPETWEFSGRLIRTLRAIAPGCEKEAGSAIASRAKARGFGHPVPNRLRLGHLGEMIYHRSPKSASREGRRLLNRRAGGYGIAPGSRTGRTRCLPIRFNQFRCTATCGFRPTEALRPESTYYQREYALIMPASISEVIDRRSRRWVENAPDPPPIRRRAELPVELPHFPLP